MSNLFIPNQPIHFGYPNLNDNPPCYCKRGQDFYLPIEKADITRFQVPNLCGQTITTGLINPSGFASQAEFDQWLQGTGNDNSTVWTYDSGTAKTAGDSKILVAYTPVLVNAISAGIQYAFTINVTLCTDAIIHIVAFNSWLGDFSSDDYVILESYDTSGTHTFTWTAENSYVAIGFYVEGACASETFTTVDSFTLQSWANNDCYSICLKDLDGNVVDTDIATFTYYQDYAIGEIDWTALGTASGCYTICFCDDDISFAINLFTDAENGSFDGGATTGLTLTVGAASSALSYRDQYSYLYTVDSIPTGTVLFNTSSYTLKRNTTYTIEARVYVDAADSPVTDATVIWQAINFTGNVTVDDGQLEPGTDNQTWRKVYLTFTTGTDNVGSFRLSLSGIDWQTVYNGTAIYVDQIRLYEEDVVVNCSQPVSLIDSHDCTLYFEYSNDNTFAGFEYPTGFEFTVRIPGWIGQPRFPEDVREIKNESGDIIPYYSESSEVQIMKVSQAPEWLHAAIRLALRHDNLTIDETEYTKIVGDYAPEWRNNNCLAPATVELRAASSAKRNTYC